MERLENYAWPCDWKTWKALCSALEQEGPGTFFEALEQYDEYKWLRDALRDQDWQHNDEDLQQNDEDGEDGAVVAAADPEPWPDWPPSRMRLHRLDR